MKVGEVLAVLEESAERRSATARHRCQRCRTVPEVPKGQVPKAVARVLPTRKRHRPRRTSPRRTTSKLEAVEISTAAASRSKTCLKARTHPAPAPQAAKAPHPGTQGTVRTPGTQAQGASRRAQRDARAHDEAARDHRAPAGRSAADRGHADHLQRGRHERRDAAARAPQGSVHQEIRRRRRHRVVLREGGDRRAQGIPADQRRDPGRRDRLQALLRHRHGGGRRGRPGRAGASRCRSHELCRHRAGDSRFRQARAGRHR